MSEIISLSEARERLANTSKIKIPIEAEYSVGQNWRDTH